MDTPTQLDRIEASLAKVAAWSEIKAKTILSTDEAMALAGCNSAPAFSRWATTWGVSNSGKGRWPRHRVEAGLEKEARGMTRLRSKRGGKGTSETQAKAA